MSKTDDTFVAAFPFAFTDKSKSEFDGEQFADMGMSLRDYFAAKAMAGVIIANPEWGKKPAIDKRIAEIAYRLADSMLKEREK